MTVGHDRSVRLWDLADGSQLASFEGEALMTAVALSPDDRTVAVGDHAGNVHLFAIDLGFGSG